MTRKGKFTRRWYFSHFLRMIRNKLVMWEYDILTINGNGKINHKDRYDQLWTNAVRLRFLGQSWWPNWQSCQRGIYPSLSIGWTDRSAGCGSERSHFRRHGSLICSRAIYFLVDTSFAFPPTQRQVPEPNDPLQIPSPSNETNSTQHQSDSLFPLWLPFFQPPTPSPPPSPHSSAI